MDNSEGSYAKKFYEGSYYESKIKDVDKKREKNNNSPKNNNDYFLITSDPKKRMENLIKNFECMIGKRKSEILKEFDKISLKLKEYKNNSNFPNELDIIDFFIGEFISTIIFVVFISLWIIPNLCKM